MELDQPGHIVPLQLLFGERGAGDGGTACPPSSCPRAPRSLEVTLATSSLSLAMSMSLEVTLATSSLSLVMSLSLVVTLATSSLSLAMPMSLEVPLPTGSVALSADIVPAILESGPL